MTRNMKLRTFAAAIAMSAALITTACSDATGPGERPTVALVDVIAPAPALAVGATMKVRAVPRDGQGVLLKDRTVRWSSSDTTVITVDQTGLVSALNVGSAQVTARVDGRDGHASIQVSATHGPGNSELILQIGAGAEKSMTGNRIEQLYANLLTKAGLVVAIFPHSPAGYEITWSSSNPMVASVSDSGVVTTGWAGTAIISAVSQGLRAEIVVVVRSAVRTVAVPAENPYRMAIGATKQLSVQVSPATYAPAERPVTWTSGNERVATVDANGEVTARAPGFAIIYANVEGVLGRSQVEVAGDFVLPLEGIAGKSLPALIQSKYLIEGDVAREQRVIATGGSFAMTRDPQYGQPTSYALRLTLRVEEDGRIPREVQYVDEGRVITTWTGVPLFVSNVHDGMTFEIEEVYEAVYWRTGEVEINYTMPGFPATNLRFGKP